MKLLVIDDSDLDLKSWDILLDELNGVDVVYAKSPRESVKLLAENKDFDIVFTDFYMRNDTGISVLDMMDTLRIKTPVYLFTGRTDSAEIDSRFKGVINKSELESKIKEVLGAK